MRKFLADEKTLNRVLGTWKTFLYNQSFIMLFAIGVTYLSKDKIFLLLMLIMPIIYIYAHYKIYTPILREADREIKLQQKYKLLHDRFIKIT